MYEKCKRCRGNILSHTIYMECCVCKYKMHLQCIPISRNEYDELLGKSDEWIYPLCLPGILPFNHYEDDTDYCDALMYMFYGIGHFSVRFQENTFIPFELTDFDKRLPIFYIDPDLHLFQTLIVICFRYPNTIWKVHSMKNVKKCLK